MGHAQRANIHEAVQQAVEAWEDPNIEMDRKAKTPCQKVEFLEQSQISDNKTRENAFNIIQQ